MTRVIQTRNGPGQNFDTVYVDDVKEMHCDGFGDVMLSPSIIKMSLYQTRPVDLSEQPKDPANAIEHRHISLILAMSPSQLLQGLLSLLSGMAANASALEAASMEERAQIAKLLSAIKIPAGSNAIFAPKQSEGV